MILTYCTVYLLVLVRKLYYTDVRLYVEESNDCAKMTVQIDNGAEP